MKFTYEWEQAWDKFEKNLTPKQQSIIVASMMLLGVAIMFVFHLILISLCK